MTTCNGARFLEQQLDDIARQTKLPSELVICDDRSEDSTVRILEQFRDRAPFPVNIHSNERRLGYRQNFVKAAGLCRSEIVFFCDQDDRWAPEKLETVLGYFERPETQLVYHQADLIDQDGAPIGGKVYSSKKHQSFARLEFSPWETPLGFTQAFRRSLTHLDRFWEMSFDPTTADEPLAHDQWYIFLASVLGSIEYAPESLAGYRQHRANTFGIESVRIPALSRIGRKALEAGVSLERRHRAADIRAEILERLYGDLPAATAKYVRTGKAKYQELAERCERRAALYGADGLRSRIAVMRSLLSENDYGRDAWHFGSGALAMDLSIGLSGWRPVGKTSAPDSGIAKGKSLRPNEEQGGT